VISLTLLGNYQLASEAEEEAEDLSIVGIGVVDRESEVERQGSGSHRGNHHSEAKSRGDAEILRVQFDILFDGTIIAEHDSSQHIVRCQREDVL